MYFGLRDFGYLARFRDVQHPFSTLPLPESHTQELPDATPGLVVFATEEAQKKAVATMNEAARLPEAGKQIPLEVSKYD